MEMRGDQVRISDVAPVDYTIILQPTPMLLRYEVIVFINGERRAISVFEASEKTWHAQSCIDFVSEVY